MILDIETRALIEAACEAQERFDLDELERFAAELQTKIQKED